MDMLGTFFMWFGGFIALFALIMVFISNAKAHRTTNENDVKDAKSAIKTYRVIFFVTTAMFLLGAIFKFVW